MALAALAAANMVGQYSTPDDKPKGGLFSGSFDLGVLSNMLGGGVPDQVEPYQLEQEEDAVFLYIAVIIGGLLMAGVGFFIFQQVKK